MARVVGKLAPAKVTALAKAKRPGLYGDGAGLWLRIGQGGAASWVLRYMRGGKAHEMGLGPLHTYGLAEAREWARRYRQELHDGIDPLASRAAAKASAKPIITFGQVAEMYLTAHAPSWRSEIHRRQWRQTLDQYVLLRSADPPGPKRDRDRYRRGDGGDRAPTARETGNSGQGSGQD